MQERNQMYDMAQTEKSIVEGTNTGLKRKNQSLNETTEQLSKELQAVQNTLN